MRIFLFLILLLLLWGCSTVKVTKEVIKVTNTITDKVKESTTKKESEGQAVLDKIIEEKEIEEEIQNIEVKQKEERNIVESQVKLAEINFIGKSENKILSLLGQPHLSRIDGSVYTLRYDTNNCRLFLFLNQEINNKRVEYFELRNSKAKLLNSKKVLEGCYKEFGLLD